MTDPQFELNENGEVSKVTINSSGSDWEKWEKKANEHLKKLVDKEVFKAQYSVIKNIIQRETRMTEQKLTLDEMKEIARQREELNELKLKQEAVEEFLDNLPKPTMTKEELQEHYKNLQQEHLQEIQEDDPWKFMVAWNCETGCGSTYCLYMTATYDEEVARKRFEDKFGDYYVNFMEFYSRKDFFDKFSSCIPEGVKDLSTRPCSLEFFTEVHYSFS